MSNESTYQMKCFTQLRWVETLQRSSLTLIFFLFGKKNPMA